MKGDDQKLPPVPTGIQRLLRLASVSEGLCRELCAGERTEEVASAAGVKLSRTELAILEAIPSSQLARMARQIPEAPSPRRHFLRQTAASAVILLGGAAMAESIVACDSKDGATPRPADEEVVPRPDDRVISAGVPPVENTPQPPKPPQPPQPPPPTPDPPDNTISSPPEPVINRPPDRLPAPGGAAPDFPPGSGSSSGGH